MSEPNVNGNNFEIPLAKQGEIKITDYILESLDKVAKAENFQDYEIEVDHGSSIGDGFVGLLIKVTIKDKVNSEHFLKVLVKIPPESEARRQQMGAIGLFEREIYVYNVLLPEFVELQKERNISIDAGFYNFPKVYFAEFNKELNDAIIIMEDLRDSGHRMWDKQKPINYEHSKVFLTALGRYHALSFAMKKLKPEKFEKFKELDDFITGKRIDQSFIGYLQTTVAKAADLLDESELKKKEKLKNLTENLYENLKFCLQPEEAEPFTVVTHGDCWFNNFVYHYKKKDLPDNIVLIDWQVSRYCSPVIDIVYFLLMCTDHELRQKHFDELLNIYHNSLKELLEKLGGDIFMQFPFTALLRHLKKFGKLGLITSSMAIPMFFTNKEDMVDMDFMAEQLKNLDPVELEVMMKAYMEKMNKSNDRVDKRIKDVLIDCFRYGYL
ncbi:hypothetical protein PVAND_001482 [Polypedilum vanderplanki]|uniref:CHK kinase-like domain-containing protein n=2 Tax=Polypedilum vanderplanki TaxID=319348 RepID=A0A9J6BNK3_POLVA|nr:hypothetical protein PVAND_001482 [Polypedilum vanderplanki]